MPEHLKAKIKSVLDVSNELIEEAYIIASHKLQLIIEREGIADGKRLSDDYLFQLIMEQIGILNFQRFTIALFHAKEKEQVA